MADPTEGMKRSIAELGQTAFGAGASTMKAAILQRLVDLGMTDAARVVLAIEVQSPQQPADVQPTPEAA